MTAAATAVKEITLTFNKAVADTTVAKITVKKGNATPTFTAKWADDKKSVVLAMDSKLTKGTYDVTVSGLEKEDLTASVTVEDQKLVAFELLSTNLVADALPASFGTIKIKAVDQYGKFIKANNVTVTSSFGTLYDKADSNGSEITDKKVSVSSDPTAVNFKLTSALAVIGSKGTITIVGENGVNLTSEITLVAPSQAAKVESLGLYNKTKQKFMDMTAGDTISDYVLALKFTDQYNTELTFDEVKNVSATVAGGTTEVNGVQTTTVNGVTTAAPVKQKINDKDVYTLPLTGTSTKVKAGTIQITLVNTQYGLLDNLSFTVAPGTVIKSFTVSADNEIFNDADTELSYTAIDADGNEVTKYDVLDKAFKDTLDARAGLPNHVVLRKQADGSAKLILERNSKTFNTSNNNYKESQSDVLVFTLYTGSTNTIVTNTPIKVNENRVFWEVTGVDSKHALATTGTNKLEFAVSDLKIADQYGNTLTSDWVKNLVNETNYVKVEKAATATDWQLTNDELKNSTTKATIEANSNSLADNKKNVDITFKSGIDDAKDDGYKVTLSQEDPTAATDFAIEWTDGIKTFNVSDGALDLSGTNANNGNKAYFSVVGKVGGKKVTIPVGQYTITGGKTQSQNTDGTKDRITKTATLTVVVDDKDHNSNTITAEYTYSNADSKLTTLKVADTVYDITYTGEMNKDTFANAAFTLKDQYGKPMAASSIGDLTANVTILEGKGVVKYNGTNQVKVSNATDGNVNKISVTFTCGDLTATKEIKVNQ